MLKKIVENDIKLSMSKNKLIRDHYLFINYRRVPTITPD